MSLMLKQKTNKNNTMQIPFKNKSEIKTISYKHKLRESSARRCRLAL